MISSFHIFYLLLLFVVDVDEIDNIMARTGNARTLHAAMVAPSTTSPDVVVIDSIDAEVKVQEIVDPKKDLWVSTVDG